MPVESIGTPVMWAGFLALVVAILALDLGVFHRRAHEVSTKEAAAWTAVWIGLAAIFNVGIYFLFGPRRALEFATGYLIEKALAVDNIFVFVVIFQFYAVPLVLQHRVLFWGILGALVMRAAFIVVGAAFLQRYHFAVYVFGGLLIVTGVRLLAQKEEVSPGDNFVVRLVRRALPVTQGHAAGRFFVRDEGRLLVTPLLLALLTVELSDVVFALDSIPAIFAVTTDPFIVFTSNIFAIMGLRSMYFLLARFVQKFHYLKIGLALILVFVGVKMLVSELYAIPILASLGVIAGILGLSVIASIIRSRTSRAETARG